jgi:hypothetical protein
LLLTSGKRPATLMLAPLKQGKEFKYMVQVLDEIVWIRGDEGTHLQVFQNCHARENPASLRRLRDPEPSDLMGGKVGNVPASEQNPSFGGARAPEDRHHERAFAGAVGADQRHDLAEVNVEAHAVQHRDPAVAASDLLDCEQRRAHCRTSRSTFATSSSGTPR